MASINRTWINSIVIVSAEKNVQYIYWYNFINAKIYSIYLVCILKVKYTEFKVSYFTTFSSAGLAPALSPCSTMAKAPAFSHNKVIALDLQKCRSEESLSTAPWCFLLSFIS